MSDAKAYAISHPNVSMADIEKMFNKKGNDMATAKAKASPTIEMFNGKKIVNVKDNIQMTVVDGKLSALNIISFDLVEEDAEVKEQSFFAGADSKEETIRCEAYLLVDVDNELFINPNTSWLSGEQHSFKLDSYPEEMIPIISKSINSNLGLAKGYDKDEVMRLEHEADITIYPELLKSMETLSKAHKELMAEVKKFKSMDGSANLDDFLDRYFFKKHILIQGEKGGGKTYTIDKKIRSEKIDSELIIGHEGIEAIDLLGYYVKTATGDLVWLDGALTKAFRKGLSGTVCLFIDEMLRIPARELNILVGSLTPSSAGTYRLRTNRVVNIDDGIGETEIIEIPMSNLWCVGITNVGAGYQVDDIDEALADRFRVVNKTTSNTELESILNSYVTGKLTPVIVPMLLEFYTQMRDLMASGELEKVINTRHLCEVLQLAEDNSEVKSYLLDLIPTWTSMDTSGQPNKAEKDIITKLIKKIIK